MKTQQELDAILLTADPEFRAFVASMPATYWGRYDLSACRIGWHFGRAALQDDMSRLIEHAAAVSVAFMDDNSDLATGSWLALPEHLQALLNTSEERIETENRE